MPLILSVGSDGEKIGTLRVTGGRIEPVADTDSARQSLDSLWQDYARKMVEYDGADGDSLTPEDILKYMAARMNGRAWATLANEPEKMADAAPAPTSRKPNPGTVIQSGAKPATGEVALAGADGAQLARLLGKSKAFGVKTMAELVAGAVGRFKGTARLLNHGEVVKLADALAAVNSTAELLGRVRVREMADRANVWQGRDAPPDVPFQRFAAEAPGVLVTPEAAVEYFTSLQPDLGIDPDRFPGQQRRAAFTLAESANLALTQRVQKMIADAVKGNTGAGEATATIRQALDAAGVNPKNPQYSEMVFRTNAMDAFQTGAYEEGTHPDVADVFPCWRYLGIDDERAGADHRPKFDKYFPRSAAFADVRGNRPFNCRCSLQWVDKYEWDELKAHGHAMESKW